MKAFGSARNWIRSFSCSENKVMKISDAELDDFIQTWQNAFDERLTRDEAYRELSKLVELLRVLSRPLPDERTTPPKSPPAEAHRGV